MRLAKEMEKLKWEEQRDKRFRQQLKENRYIMSFDLIWPLFGRVEGGPGGLISGVILYSGIHYMV